MTIGVSARRGLPPNQKPFLFILIHTNIDTLQSPLAIAKKLDQASG
jgi:hypothetical protein